MSLASTIVLRAMLGLLVLAGSATTVEPPAPDILHGAAPIAVSRVIDLGVVPVGTTRDGELVFVNTSTAPVKLVGIEAANATVTFREPIEPVHLKGRHARRHAFSVVAPDEPGAMVAKLALTFDGFRAVTVEVRLEAVPEAEFRRRPQLPTSPLRSVPNRLQLGELPASSLQDGAFWLVNPGDAPLRVLKVKASCSCLTFADIDIGELAPGQAVSVPFTLDVPKETDQVANKTIQVLVKPGPPLRVPLSVQPR